MRDRETGSLRETETDILRRERRERNTGRKWMR